MTTKRKAQGGARSKGLSEADARRLAELLDTVTGAGKIDLFVNAVVDAIHDTSQRLGLDAPDDWLNARTRGEGVGALAAWLRKVPPTFSLRDRKESRPREIYDERGAQRNPLTGAELAGLAKEVGGYFTADKTGASLYLLLLYSLANEADEADRSAAYFEACESLSLSIDGVTAAFEADHVRTLAELRKGGVR